MSEPHLMHGLVRGIYVAKGDQFALSIQLTEKEENYGAEMTYLSPSKWKIDYRPPTAKNPENPRAKSDTQALKNCYDRGVPVGILRTCPGGNEVLGLGRIKDIDGGNFKIIPESLNGEEKDQAKGALEIYIKKKMAAGDYSAPDVPTTHVARVGQEIFRARLLEIYGARCGFCGIDIEELLIASHIVAWKLDKENRLNPRNGLLLCRLCDRAFEIGRIRLTPDLKILQDSLSTRLHNSAVRSWLSNIGAELRIKILEGRPDMRFIETKNKNLV